MSPSTSRAFIRIVDLGFALLLAPVWLPLLLLGLAAAATQGLPIFYRAERIEAPLLILHGRKDKRVVPLMSEMGRTLYARARTAR